MNFWGITLEWEHFVAFAGVEIVLNIEMFTKHGRMALHRNGVLE